MLLAIDIGNTRCKAALFRDGDIVRYLETDAAFSSLGSVAAEADRCIYCSTRDEQCGLHHRIEELKMPVVRLTDSVPVPLDVAYHTPHTLGMDRIAAAVGAWGQGHGHDLLVIDAGTALTIDFVSSDGVYTGGNISPGASLRFRALHEFTGKLPLVQPCGPVPLFGYTTDTAIRSGVILGVVSEINGYIDSLRKDHPSLLVFLTGGDSELFEKRIKSPIFADKFLVLKGLDLISEYEKDK